MATLVTIKTFYSLPEAAVAQSCLEAHGFFSTCPDRFLLTLSWHHMFALQGVRLWAMDCDEADARELLEAAAAYKVPETVFSWNDALLALGALLIAWVPYPARWPPPPDTGQN